MWGPKLTKDEWYFDEWWLMMDSQRGKQSEGPNDLLWEMVGEGSFTKNMVWRRISGRRGQMVEADKKNIWDNRSFLRICCTGLSILKISWATCIILSWFLLSWKLTSGATIRMKTISSDSSCIRNDKDNICGIRNWRRMFGDGFSAKEIVRRIEWASLRNGCGKMFYKWYGLKKDYWKKGPKGGSR